MDHPLSLSPYTLSLIIYHIYIYNYIYTCTDWYIVSQWWIIPWLKDDNCLQEPTFWMKGTATLTRLQAAPFSPGNQRWGDDWRLSSWEHRISIWCLIISMGFPTWMIHNNVKTPASTEKVYFSQHIYNKNTIKNIITKKATRQKESAEQKRTKTKN